MGVGAGLSGGVEVAWLATFEARAWAKLGDREAMNAALDIASSAWDVDGPVAGVGVIAYPYSNQLRMAATVRLWAGDHGRARTELAEALELLAQEYDSLTHIAVTRADLALAHLHAGDLGGAAEVLQPLLRLTGGGSYLAGAARRSGVLIGALRTEHYQRSNTARQLVADIEEFVSAQKSNGEAAEAVCEAGADQSGQRYHCTPEAAASIGRNARRLVLTHLAPGLSPDAASRRADGAEIAAAGSLYTLTGRRQRETSPV